jgi:hypothetical protein
MKKLLAIFAAILFLGSVGVVVTRKASNQGAVGAYRETYEHFVGGFYAGSTDQFSVDSSGNVSTSGDLASTDDITASDDITATDALTGKNLFLTGTGTSSTSPHALSAAKALKITIPASSTTALASTTAVTANSIFVLTQTATTTVVSTTCNSHMASGTLVSSVLPGSGFEIKTQIAPTTNPFCYDVLIIN